MARTTLKGFEQATEKLARIGISVTGPEAYRVVIRGAQIIRGYAEASAPRGEGTKKPGSLKRAHIIRALPAKPGRPVGAMVMVNLSASRGTTAPHAHLVEKGTKAHTIRRKDGKVLALFGGRVFVREVKHPGAKATNYFRDAVRAKRAEARKVIREELQKLVERSAR